MEDNYNLRWNDFEKGLLGGVSEILDQKELFDISLMCEGSLIQAHKLVLSSCSPVFRTIINQLPHPDPVVYMRGISAANMRSLLNFMYRGEVNIKQSTITEFLATADDLQVKGLTQKESKEASSGDMETSPRNKRFPKIHHNHSSSKKRAKTSPAKSLSEVSEVKSLALPSSLDQYSSQQHFDENQIIIPGLKENDLSDIVDNHYSEDMNDYGPDYLSMSDENLYSNQQKGLQGQNSALRHRRQQVVAFISIHKVRLENCYECLLCKKQSTDNSNMNKHIEFTHSKELTDHLASIADLNS